MKKYAICVFLFLLTFLYGCTKPESADVSFIHAVGFDENDEGIIISAIVENTENSKASEENTENVPSDESERKAAYSVFTGKGTFPQDAVKDLMSQFGSYRFGTSDAYYFSESLSRTALCEIAGYLPSNPVFPVKCGAVCVSGISVKRLFSEIRDENALNGLSELCNDGAINVITFLGKASDTTKHAIIPTVTFGKSARRVSDTVYRSFAPTRIFSESGK